MNKNTLLAVAAVLAGSGICSVGFGFLTNNIDLALDMTNNGTAILVLALICLFAYFVAPGQKAGR